MGYGLEGGRTTGGFDEFQCFHISEFEVNDAIIVDTELDGKVRGVVTAVDLKSCYIQYQSSNGLEVVSLNDVCFLSGFERGWLQDVG
jgi:hypothetical protein